MCGRIVRAMDDEVEWLGYLADESATRLTPDLRRYIGRYNIAPTQEDILLRPAARGGREVVASRWGVIPRWAKERGIASKTFNARAETLLERTSFKGLVARHRCIVPISGYYEWRKRGTTKTPLYIHRTAGGPLALAGLWTEWAEPESGEVVTSHTVITCAANESMKPIHERMPVILTGEALDAWLDPGLDRSADLLPLLAPAPDDLLAAYAVAPLVNSVRNDGPELIRPVAAA